MPSADRGHSSNTRGTGPSLRCVARGTAVDATDGFVGTVGELVIDDESGVLTGFVLHKGLVAVVDVFIPADWVAEATRDRIRLLVNRYAVDRLVDPHDLPTI